MQINRDIDRVQELFVPENAIEKTKSEALSLPRFDIGKIDMQWLQVLAEGWAAPLGGFMNEEEYLQVLIVNSHRFVWDVVTQSELLLINICRLYTSTVLAKTSTSPYPLFCP